MFKTCNLRALNDSADSTHHWTPPHSPSKPRKINRQAESVCTIRRSIVKLKLIQGGICPYQKKKIQDGIFPFPFMRRDKQEQRRANSLPLPQQCTTRHNKTAAASHLRGSICPGAAAQEPGRNRPQNCEEEDKNPAHTRHKNDGIRPTGDQNQRNWCEKDLPQPGEDQWLGFGARRIGFRSHTYAYTRFEFEEYYRAS
jgi:hypothetical protein